MRTEERENSVGAPRGARATTRNAHAVRVRLSKPSRLARLDWRELVAVFVGGALGGVVRVWIGRRFPGASVDAWPWLTLSINVSGSFLLGFFATRLQDRLPQSTYGRPLLGTGFCGAYTTFATMQVEIVKMIDRHDYGLALAYGLTSIACGYLAIWIATALVRRVRTLA